MAHPIPCSTCYHLDDKTDCRGCILREYFTTKREISALRLLVNYMSKDTLILKLEDLRSYGGSIAVFIREMSNLVPRLSNFGREIDQLDVEVANLKSQVAVLMDALKLNKKPIEGESSVGNSQYVVQDVGLNVVPNVGQGVGLNVGQDVGLNVGQNVGLNVAQNLDELNEYDSVSRLSDSMNVCSGSGDECVSNSLKVKGGDDSGNDDGDDVYASPK